LFELATFLTRMLGGLDVPGIQEQVVTWLKEKGAEYPDLKDRTDALASFIAGTIVSAGAAMDPLTMSATIKGIAEDIVNGTNGVNYDNWGGGA